MPPLVTVVIPTYDHGRTLDLAARSVLAQSMASLELFIVGDGVPDITREVVDALRSEDRRVRFFDNPKGARHGELHRHAALAQSQGRFVAYLSDDDLWFPEHLEVLAELLEDADLAHTLPTNTGPDGKHAMAIVDLSLARHRQAILDGGTGPSLSTTGHTAEAYRRLPFGWRTTPKGTHTDVYMWRQFLAEPWCRARSSRAPTAIHLASAARQHATEEDRLAEQARWSRLLGDEGMRRRYVEQLLGVALGETLWWMEHDDHLSRWAHDLERQLKELDGPAAP